jgi:hypothetical protein
LNRMTARRQRLRTGFSGWCENAEIESTWREGSANEETGSPLKNNESCDMELLGGCQVIHSRKRLQWRWQSAATRHAPAGRSLAIVVRSGGPQ